MCGGYRCGDYGGAPMKFTVEAIALAYVPLGSSARAATAERLEYARYLGIEGEMAVRRVYDIGGTIDAKVAIEVAGRTRYPDGMNFFLRTLSEVKNTGYQAFTLQLRDDVAWAQQNGFTFFLYVRPGARLSGPLLEARAQRQVIILDIPF
jgi:hypothetical protein